MSAGRVEKSVRSDSDKRVVAKMKGELGLMKKDKIRIEHIREAAKVGGFGD